MASHPRLERRRWWVPVLALVVASSALAQDTPPEPQEYRLGLGDTLEVAVVGNQDVSRIATISPGGSVTLPLIGAVEIAGLTVAEAQQKIADRLATDHLVNPRVEIRIRQYGSRFALVVGEMRTPGRHPLRPGMRLIDLLADAGGFTTEASGEVAVTRAEGSFPDGTRTLRARLTRTNARPEDTEVLATPLRAGDLLVAASRPYVIVEGEVARPGRFPLEEQLTITRALWIAGGITRYGSTSVKLHRTDTSGRTQILSVDLNAIARGRKPDLPLQADDMVTVPRRLF